MNSTSDTVYRDESTELDWAIMDSHPVLAALGAANYCAQFIFDESSNWRLPTILELLIAKGDNPVTMSENLERDYGVGSPITGVYWTSSIDDVAGSSYWTVDFSKSTRAAGPQVATAGFKTLWVRDP